MGKRLEVPYRQLTKEKLHRVIKAFVSQESADAGYSELSMDQKVLRVTWLLEAGRAKLVFDPSTKSHVIIKCDP